MDLRTFGPSDTVRSRTGLTLHAFLTRLIWWCMGPLVLLAAYLATDRVRQMRDEHTLETTSVAKALASAVDHDLNARIGALTVLAASPLLDDASRWNELYQEAQGYRQTFGSHVILADLQMQMRFNTRVPFGTALPALPRPEGRAAAPIAAQTGRPAVGDSFHGPLAKEPLVAVAVPAVRNGKTVGLLLTVFEAHQFQKHLERMALPPGWSLTLLDSSGAQIARRAPADSARQADTDAGGRLVVACAMSPWSVALDVPSDSYRKPLLQAAAALVLAVLGATLAGVVGGTLASRRLAESVSSLVSRRTGGAARPQITEIAAVRDLLDDAAQRREAAEGVRRRLAAIVESSDDAIVSSTMDGVVTSWNGGAERMFGVSADEALGRPVREVIRPDGDEMARTPERRIFHTRRDAGQAGAEEVVRLHKDGRPITLSVVTGVIRDAAGAASEVAAIMRDITQARRRDAELQRLLAEQAARERLMRDLIARLRTLREEECTRISREVHDGLGQLLTCLKMDIRWMSRRLAAGAGVEDLSSKLAETEALVDQTVTSVQRIAVELRPSVLDALGLPAAIRDEARRFEARTGVATAVETSTSAVPGPAMATALFRILQELLTNIARHANASSASITLTDDGDAWLLHVLDNGVGIPVDMVDRATSLGLLGMIERAEAIGGTCRVERAPNGGTLATVRVPHTAASESACATS